MLMDFTGKVYSVGDGLCYEGCWRSERGSRYHMVIDCGNRIPTCRKKWKGKLSTQMECDIRLQEVTDEIADNGQCLDLFILTHLHTDHYSGYRYLFRKTSIETIIMPYLYPEERLCLIIANGLGEGEQRFMARPYSEILQQAQERNPNVRLILVRGNESHSEQNQDANNVNLERSTIWGQRHAEQEEILEAENLSGTRVEVVSTVPEGINVVGIEWIFKLYNLEADRNEIDVLRRVVGKLDARRLHDIITDPHKLRNVRNIYTKIAGSYGNDINNTSIVIYHAPYDCPGRSGSWIMGDIDLRRYNITCEILKFFEREVRKIGLFSIPHHGSDDSWNELLIGHGNLDSTVCFASTHNYYSGRLTSVMMSDLRRHNICVMVVDENRFSEIEQIISVGDKWFTRHIIRRCRGISEEIEVF